MFGKHFLDKSLSLNPQVVCDIQGEISRQVILEVSLTSTHLLDIPLHLHQTLLTDTSQGNLLSNSCKVAKVLPQISCDILARKLMLTCLKYSDMPGIRYITNSWTPIKVSDSIKKVYSHVLEVSCPWQCLQYRIAPIRGAVLDPPGHYWLSCLHQHI